MKIIQEVTFHEMLKRFAIGETYSDFFRSTDGCREEMLRLLKSGDQDQEKTGIHRVLEGRKPLVECLRQCGAEWHLARLPVNIDEFSAIQTFPDSGWNSHSRGTQKLIDAAINLRDAPGTDGRVDKIVSAFKRGGVEMQGITLLGHSVEGPFTVVEGNGRLVAVYLCCVTEQSSPTCQSDIDVVLGITPNC